MAPNEACIPAPCSLPFRSLVAELRGKDKALPQTIFLKKELQGKSDAAALFPRRFNHPQIKPLKHTKLQERFYQNVKCSLNEESVHPGEHRLPSTVWVRAGLELLD